MKINRNTDFDNENMLDKYLYCITLECYINEDCEDVEVSIDFDEYQGIIKNKIIVENDDDSYINLEYYTKDKSKLKGAEEEMMEKVYKRISAFIEEHSKVIKPYTDLLNKSNFYREKKLKRILKEE